MPVVADRPAVGREPELAEVGRFLDDVAAGPAALQVEGPAGIGKTTIWRAAVAGAAARGMTVVAATALDLEADLPFVVLRDLLEDVPPELAARLPPAQRQALDVALLRAAAPPGPVDQQAGQHAVSVAVLGVVRALAARGPLVIAVDDAGWLDRSSDRVLRYVVRRLDAEPVGVLAARRTPVDEPAPLGLDGPPFAGRRRRLVVAPLTEEQMHELLTGGAALPLPRRLARGVHRAAAGNPFYGLQIGRALSTSGARVLDDGAVPVPGDLAAVTARRVAALTPPARRALAVCAVARAPTVALVAALLGASAPDAVAEAVDEGLLTASTAGLAFAHPLLRAAASATLSSRERAEVHGLLADAVTDPDERAAHLAAAATGPDEAVAAAVTAAARRAFARGAPDDAAVLADRAAALTPPGSPALHERTVRSGEYRYRAEDIDGAGAVLAAVLPQLPPGELRAEAALWLCYVRQAQNRMAEVAALGRAALDDDPRPALRAAVERDLAYALVLDGNPVAADRHAVAALATARRSGDPVSVGESEVALAWTGFWRGAGLRTDLLAGTRTRSTWTRFTPQGVGPCAFAAILLAWSDAVDEGRAALLAEDALLLELGLDRPRMVTLFTLTELECRAGDTEAALRHARIGLRTAELTGDPFYGALVRYAHGLVLAHRGELDAAAAEAGHAVAAGRGGGAAMVARFGTALLGFVALSAGDHAAAHRHLGPLVATLPPTYDPGLARFVPDEVEALARMGKAEEAAAVLAPFAAQAAALDRPSALGAAGRCRALLAAGAGDLPAALAATDEALAAHDRVALPFERARTLLVAGSVRRRARRRAEARAALDEALAEFDRLGAPAWAAMARAERDRLAGHRRPGPLTGAELRVAELVTAGRSNQEVATELFLSVATVEATLWRIYRKLDVRSRTELAARLRS